MTHKIWPRTWGKVSRNSTINLLLWCLPALSIGALLRYWLMQGWSAGFYFGPDSSTYWHPVLRFYTGESFSISGKRPWLYPVLMLITKWGPGSPAFSAALLQHAFGLIGVLPLAALLRHLLPRWRWWVIPCTTIYAVHPQLFYWEHVLIADSVFTVIVLLGVWAFCWFWRSPTWWLMGLAFGLFFLAMATRPPGRALWLCALPLLLLVPGLTWKKRFWRLVPVLTLYPLANLATAVNQGDPLFFASVFPLIVLENPKHADLKREFAPTVIAARSNLWRYVTEDQQDEWRALAAANAPNIGPVYTELVKSQSHRRTVISELTREAIVHHPFRYAGMIVLKIYYVISQNTKCDRLEPEAYKSGMVKFLTTSLRKVSPEFPAFLLRDERATTREGIDQVITEQLSDRDSQRKILNLLPRLIRVTSVYELPETSECVPLPRHAAGLVLFIIGLIAWPFAEQPRNYLPVFVLGTGYLALTLVVGRAVERYRLPAEFLLILGVFVGLDAIGRLVLFFLRSRRHSDAQRPTSEMS